MDDWVQQVDWVSCKESQPLGQIYRVSHQE